MLARQAVLLILPISSRQHNRSPNSFSCNTYGFRRKCCKQKTYGMAKSFRCNTYEKRGGEWRPEANPDFQSSVYVGRENNIPEQRRRSQKLHRDQRAVLVQLRRPHYVHFHTLLRLGVLYNELCARCHAFRKDDHGPAGADRMRKALNSLRLALHVHQHAHPQQHALRAAPFFGGGLPRQSRTHATHGARFRVRRWFHVRHRFQSSSPQKSISGATSSIPYSQPSGRSLPFQTMTAALLV